MLPFISQHIPGERPARQVAEALLETVTELSEVIAEENITLASGYPAGLALTSERKTELAAEYAELWEDLGVDGAAALAADPEFGRALIAAVNHLRQAAGENITRLEAAMNASRRRVEAVLEALRQDARVSGTYGAKGDIPLELRLPPVGANFHA
jgi:hypothetical protein